jgi:hypothetical protein
LKTNIAAALGSKVAIGVSATVLAFGTAGTVLALQPASSDQAPGTSDRPAAAAAATEDTTTTTSTSTTSTTSTTEAPTTTTTAPEAGDDHGQDAHPDNFGAMVSADARDGGVDGQEISKAAHERNEARRAAHRPGQTASEDHGKADHAEGEDD